MKKPSWYEEEKSSELFTFSKIVQSVGKMKINTIFNYILLILCTCYLPAREAHRSGPPELRKQVKIGINEDKSTSLDARQSDQQFVNVEFRRLKEVPSPRNSNHNDGNSSNRHSHLHNQGKHSTSTIPVAATRFNEASNAPRSARFDRSNNGPKKKPSKLSSNVDFSSLPPDSSRYDSPLPNLIGAFNSTEDGMSSNSISNFKTNSTINVKQQSAASLKNDQLSPHKRLVDFNGTGHQMSKMRKPTEVVKKSQKIVQRDLSNKLPPPFIPSSSAFVHQIRGGFKPSDPKALNPRNLAHKPALNQGDSFKGNILDDSAGANAAHGITTLSSPSQDTMSSRYSNDRSIVRTGPILPNPLASYSQLKALMPGLFTRVDNQDDYQAQATSNQFRAFLASHHLPFSSNNNPTSHLLSANDYPFSMRATTSSLNQNLSGADQMLTASNHHSVSHLGPRTAMASTMGESSNYNSIANLQDYPDQRPIVSGHDQMTSNSQESGISSQPSAASANMGVEDHSRGGYSEADQSSFEPTASVRSATQNTAPNDQTATTNSRSSVSDVYLRTEHKNRGDSTGGAYPSRSSADPFEDLAGGLSTSEYERDLADLDEEFNRHSGYRRPSNPLMSDSFMTMSPERYEARRYNRRPSFDYTTDYLNTAGSISNIIPRPYQRSHATPWSSSPAYSDNSDLWADTSVDYNPLASFVSPNHYAYRWRPRYQRVSPYSGSPYLATSASEQQLQPAYNIIPSYTSAVPTETISYALSPLAAAAAAAASALVAADKSRHQNHGWLTLPRLTASSSISPTPTTASASTQHAATIPAGAIQAAYIHRPSPYALSSVPIYAIAPRPAAPLTTAASGATASVIPYFHGGAPTIIAYRPAGMVPSASLLAAHSFAYPLRLPVSAMHRPLTITAPTRTVGRPFYSDLAFAESKSKTNLTSNSSEGKGLVRAGSLTAMAKNLTKKMFGSASQISPQHVAPPPNSIFDQYTPSQNSSTVALSSPLSI